MILSDIDIKRAIEKGEIKITPIEPSQIGQASVDLTLSNEWFFFKKAYKKKKIDLSKIDFNQAMELRTSDSIALTPGEMCLGKTVERITLAPNIMGKLEGRSRYARMGLSIHVTSALVQPGSDNRQVLEIVNFSPNTVRIHAGMRISQVVFERTESPTSRPYKKYGSIAINQ